MSKSILLTAIVCIFSVPALLFAQAAGSDAALQKVLADMDRAAANFQTAQADFAWDAYQKVVDETDVQKGVIYFRRLPKGVDMAADITSANDRPEKKYVLYADSKVQVYQPSIEQVTEYNAGKRKAEVESFLVLGFGGGGHDLLKSFDVRYLGAETVGGMATEKLELTPKSQKTKEMFNRILLWIDPARGVSLQQQFFEPDSGNYRLAKYSNIKLNGKLPADVFKLKTTAKTRYVRPQG